MEIVRRPYGNKLIEWAKDKPQVVVLSADLTGSCEVDTFRDTYPDRFFSMGVAEQNMHSFAAGMAREGFFPFIHTFGVFIYRQALHQIIVSIAYPNLPVRMFGFLPGILTPGGMTHQATDDVAVLRAIPNMTILDCGDATDVESVLDVAQAVEGPVYARVLRGEVPRLFDQSMPMELGKVRRIREGSDIAVLTSSVCTEEAMRATVAIEKKGVSLAHLHVSTHKPFNDPAILEAIDRARYGVVTMENHTVIGGLGSEVAEVMAEAGIGKKLVRIGLRDTYAHGASRPYLMHKLGLDSISLVNAIEGLVGTRLGIVEEELASVHLTPLHSETKAEAL
jgi:transketolase